MLVGVFTLLAASLAFTVSASAGLGGSLIMVPALAVLLGAKQGIALAALLLASNNVAKLCFYRKTIPWQRAGLILVATLAGTTIGSSLLVAAPEWIVDVAIGVGLISAFAFEHWELRTIRSGMAPLLALGAGATSGFSGTSGPLKGAAIRSLDLDRMHLVGAASLVSLAGDAMKAAVFTKAKLLDENSVLIALAAIPLMVGASYLGRRINEEIGEKAYGILFWMIMCGYIIRLAFI